jgi:CDP-2,3-bis-(O-geranylgeranyl)-sn-glycerol synthase
MLWRVGQLLYLMLPAYLANMAPPFVRFWPSWNPPISDRRLGSHKTVLGAVAGVSVAIGVALIQARIHWAGSMVEYDRWPIIGLLLGVGAIGGDIVKSFLKRRRGLSPGARWVPFDQLDFAIGALLLIAPLVELSWWDVAAILAITFVGDIGVNQLAYKLRIRESAW